MKLEKDKLWLQATTIAEYVYSILDNFSEDERWTIVSKLRGRAFDVTSNVAEALGAVDPRDKTYTYGLARRDVFGIRNALLMADKSGSLELDVVVMSKLDKLAAELDAEIARNDKSIPTYMQKFSATEATS